MNKEAKLMSQVANLEAQNARIVKEKEVIQQAYEKYNAFWIAAEKHNEELEAESERLTITLQRYKQAPKIPHIKGGTCNTTCSACDCVIKRMAEIEAELAEHEWVLFEKRQPKVKEIVHVFDGTNTWQAEMLLNRMFYCEETQHELYGITHWKLISLPSPSPERQDGAE